jgi:hypothetical protein
MESNSLKDRSAKISSRLLLLGKILLFVFAAIGLFTSFKSAYAFFGEGGLESVEAVNVEDITSILVDEDGDVVFDYQIVINSAAAFKDIKSGEVFLSVVGDLSTPEQ